MEKMKKYSGVLPGLGILVFLICICVTNLLHFNYKINADIGADALLGSLMWETKELHPDLWYFSSEARIFGTLNFSAVFNGLTHNMILSQGLACCVMTVLLLLSAGWFGRASGWRTTETMLFVLMGMAVPADPVILELCYIYCCYYGLHTIVLFLTLGVYVRSIGRRKADLRSMAVCVVFAAALGVQGMRGMLVLYGPLFGIEVIRNLYRIYCRAQYCRSDKAVSLWVVILLAVNFAGTFSPFSVGQELSRNIRKGFSKLLSVVLPEMRQTLGLDHVSRTGKICLVILLLILVWMLADILLRMCRKKEIEACEWGFLILCSSPAVAALMIAFTTVEGSSRYYYMIIFAMADAVVLALRKLAAGRQRYCTYIVYLVIVILAVSNIRSVYLPVIRSQEPPQSDWYEAVRYLEDNDLTRAYSTFENANSMTALSNGRVRVAAIDSVKKMNVCKWLTRKDWYVPYVPFEEKTAYVISRTEMDDFAEFLAQHDDVYYETQAGRFYIYVSDHNYSYLED